MHKKIKKLLILLAVLVVAVIAAVAVNSYQQKQEEIASTDEVILTIESDDVTALSWEYDSSSYSFSNSDGWVYDEDEAFPVDETSISNLLSAFSEVQASFVIEDVEDYSLYGLDDPECTVVVETEDASYEITMGDYSTMDEERYVSIGDGNVYLVTSDPADYFNVDLSDLILHDSIPTLGSVSTITFEGVEDYTIFYDSDNDNAYSSDDVYFVTEDDTDTPLDADNVDTYISNISSIGLTDYATYNASDEELEEYGLNEPELTITIDYSNEDEDGNKESGTLVLYVSPNPDAETSDDEEEETTVSSEDETSTEDDTEDEDDDAAYVRIGDSGIVYVISSTEYENLLAMEYEDFCHTEVFYGDFDDVTQIDVTLDGETYTFVSDDSEVGDDEESDDQTWSYDDEVVDFSTFKSDLSILTAVMFSDNEADGKEMIDIVIHADNDNYTEVNITLYAFDSDYCLAVIDGETFGYVYRSDVINLSEDINEIILG